MSISKIDRLIHMLGDVDHRMRAIRKLESLGLEAKPAVDALWEKIILDLDGDPDEDVRVAALKTAATIDKGFSETVMRLLERLDKDKEPSWKVRVQAGLSLASIGITVDGVKLRLKQLLNHEDILDVRRAIVGAMLSHGYDHATLFDMALQTLQNANPDASPLSVDAALSIVDEMELLDEERAQALEAMWEFMRENDESGVWQVFDAILEITSDDDQTLEQLLNDSEIGLANKSLVILHRNLIEHILPQYQKSKEPILSVLLKSVKNSNSKVSETGQYRLELILEDEGPSDVFNKVLDEVQNSLDENGQGLNLLYKYREAKVKEWILDPKEKYKAAIGYFLLDRAKKLLNNCWDDNDKNKETLLAYVLEALKTQADLNFKYSCLEWLREKIRDIPPKLVGMVNQALVELNEAKEKSQEHWYEDSFTRTLELYTKLTDSLESRLLIKDIKDGIVGGDELIQKIKTVVGIESAEALRALVEAWVGWVIYDKHPSIIDFTAEAIRYSCQTVLPLVDQLAQDVPFDRAIQIELKETAPHIADLLKQGNRVKPADEGALREWIRSYENRSDAFTELFQKAKEQGWPLKKQAEEILRALELERQRDKRLVKNRRITRQLSDMSDRRFFGEQREIKYAEVRRELEAHAVPVLVRLLPNETDTEIREHLARTLGNLGGREAVDTLVRAVVDEEKKRNARQDLLSTYYLEPSKKQSEEAATILSGAVNDAKRTLRLLQGLNVAIFVVGMLLLLAGTLTSLYSQDIASRFIGGLAGLGGLTGVIIQLINNPLDRIQNAMANLVQIETAFTSFIWELNLNGTYIQSQYVAEGILTNDEITQTVGRIENAMSLAMNLVAVYTEEGRQRVVTRINSLSPAAGNSNNLITVHGQHLQGDNSQKKIQTGIIAINHIPIQPLSLSWKEEAVRFKLPSKIPGMEGEAGTVWISLLIDGMETNALPYHVMKDGK